MGSDSEVGSLRGHVRVHRVPVLPPEPDHPADPHPRFRLAERALLPDRALRARRSRPQHRRRLRRPARPRLCRVLRHRRLHASASSARTTRAWVSGQVLPIAIAMAMLAGLLLGTPTLRLRGDYLAIVTLGLRRDHPHHGAKQQLARRPPRHHRTSRSRPASARSTSSCSTRSRTTGSPSPSSSSSSSWFGPSSAAGWAAPGRRSGRTRTPPSSWASRRSSSSSGRSQWVRPSAVSSGVLYASRVGAIVPENFTLQFSILFLAAVVLGRRGQHPGGDPRSDPRRLPARALPLPQRDPCVLVRRCVRRDDDLPAAGHLPEPAPGRRARRPRSRRGARGRDRSRHRDRSRKDSKR